MKLHSILLAALMPDGHQLRITAGQEKTHFILHPGERVRSGFRKPVFAIRRAPKAFIP